MLELWYNANMDAETPLYYIYQDKQRIGWIKNVDKEGYIDSILIYKDYRNKGYGKEALRALKAIEKRELKLDVKADNKQATRCYLKVGFVPCEAWHQSKKDYIGMVWEN